MLRFQLKLRLPDSIRRVSLTYIPNWNQFNSYLSNDLFNGNIFPVSVEYKDDENDMITISSQVEWEELVKSHEGKLVILWIKPKPIISSTSIPQLEDPEALKRKEEILKQALKKQQEEFLKIQEEALKKQLMELEEKAKQEALITREEELKQQELEEDIPEEYKKQQAEYHRSCVEMLKEMEKEIKVKEEQVTKKEEKNFNTRPVPGAKKVNNNKYIKKYSSKLQTLFEAGFTDIERNLYLLVTFNGNVVTVIERLLELQ